MSCVCMRKATKDNKAKKTEREREQKSETEKRIERGRCFLNRLQAAATPSMISSLGPAPAPSIRSPLPLFFMLARIF